MAEGIGIRAEFTSRDHALEVISAVFLSLATLASSWSAYQATRWSGVQAIAFSQASTLRVESAKKTAVAGRKFSIQVGLFVQYATAKSQNNEVLAEFLLERFPPELKKATEAWMRTDPFEDPDAPSSPFSMPEYQVTEQREAMELTEEAAESFDKARHANQTGDNYILLTVLFASVLFFSGVAPKFRAFRLRVAMLTLGGLVLVGAALVLSTYPVH
ncbi:MAG: hypothetical protein GF344_19715 [Chitinivibrionales bacterium]|nr:hypothetical protein [Chitinivibrionales bacterium]